MLRQHGHNAVYEVNAGGTVFGLSVYYRTGLNIVRNICDMHTDLNVSVGKAAHRKSIVEVLGIAGVYGKGCHTTHILARSHNTVGDAGVNLGCSFLHSLRIFVRQTVFGKNCMDFRIVLTCHTKHIHHFTLRVLGIVGPMGDTHNSFVA